MGRADFYEGLHREEQAYSAGHYHLPSLYHHAAFDAWWRGRAGRATRLLDVGCGKGLFLRELTRELTTRWNSKPARLVGLDLVRSPGDHFAQIEGPFEFVQHDSDGQPLPLADASFDFLCCNHVLEHVFATEKLVREFRRVLAPDGLCLISVPNIAAWINRIAFLWGGQPLGTELGTESITYGFRPRYFHSHLATFRPSGHIRDFTPRGLQDLTEACGFRTVGWWKQSRGWVARLGKWAGREMGILLRPAATPRSASGG
jgi:SAM-dependent methyltransferase